MKMEQIYNLMNTVTGEILGKTDLVLEDLSNVVDVGTELFGVTSVDNYVKSLVNHIGRVIFVNREYMGNAQSVLMDGWEFGSVLEKIQSDLPVATENETWNLIDQKSYDPNVFYQPKVSAKFFNKRVTFEVDISFTEKQVKESFSNSTQLNAFISMLFNSVDKSMTVKTDALIMRTINNMIAETVISEYADKKYTERSGVRAINLLQLYNARFAPTAPLKSAVALTPEKAVTDPDFIKFASLQMSLHIDRLSKMSTLFNVGRKERFTPKDLLHVIMLSEFKAGAGAYLQSDTFNQEYTALPNSETVPFWQGTGTNYQFNSTSQINVKTAEGEVVLGGVLAVMFDRDALGVTNLDKRVTSHYNPKAEFFTNFYKFDAGYFNDLNENFIVFFVA